MLRCKVKDEVCEQSRSSFLLQLSYQLLRVRTTSLSYYYIDQHLTLSLNLNLYPCVLVYHPIHVYLPVSRCRGPA